MKFMVHLSMDISGIFCLETTSYSFQIKNVDLSSVVWLYLIGNPTKASKRYSIFISREVSHCKTSKQLFGSSKNESYLQSLQTKAKCYLSLEVCSMLSQVAVWWVQFVETALRTSQTDCKGTTRPSHCHLKCLRPVEHSIKFEFTRRTNEVHPYVATHLKLHDGNQLKSCAVQQILAHLCLLCFRCSCYVNDNILNAFSYCSAWQMHADL